MGGLVAVGLGGGSAAAGAPVPGLYSGMPLEVIVVDQHVVGVYRVNG